MKIRLVIIPGEGKQVVLTPETEEEKTVLSVFKEQNISIKTGCSYEINKCLGGWYKEFNNSDSVCIILSKEAS